MSLVRPALAQSAVLSAADLARTADKQVVRVAGLVIMRQQPATAKGTTFVTLEDETGSVNLIVWKRVWARHRQVGTSAVALLAERQVQRGPGGVIHVCAARLQDLTRFLHDLSTKTRDFR